MKMEASYESECVSELPPIPPQLHPMEDSGNYSFLSPLLPLETLVPFLPSHISPSAFILSDNDIPHLQPHAESFFFNLSLPLLRSHLTESTNEFFLGGFLPDAMPFLHMPNLHSVDQSTSCLYLPPALPEGHSEKRRRSTMEVLPETLNSFLKSGVTMSPSSNSVSPASSSSQATKPYQRRKRIIVEKTQSLEKMMPWEKKMDRATMLDEAHKYIKFLQGQISVLRWMPLESIYYSSSSAGAGDRDPDLLRKLNRHQILQVILNSPAIQTWLYTHGCCVFSSEQLASLKTMMAQSSRNL